MKKIMFNDKYGLTQAVLEGRKTQTRRTFLKPGEDPLLHGITPEYLISVRSRYSLGETIAIAQKYEDLRKDDEFYRLCGKNGMPLECIKYEKGCHNKMFVRADLMPHHIRITNIRVERLQDISEEDCMAEGIRRFGKEYVRFKKEYCYTCQNYAVTDFYSFSTPREAYAALIDKISGKGTWESNPWVFVYDFELIK
ncbi:hypothetical protein [Leyella stercorea]|uniref:hypothetical protein n=1 Tax=Leyella stercorea TaxID=363265 RepID=UPI00242DF261|nr:hypothetical protein [Leyella stercorea]